MKHTKGHKVVKSARLSRPEGVRDVAMGHRAPADCKGNSRCKMDDEDGDEMEMDDTKARKARYGLTW